MITTISLRCVPKLLRKFFAVLAGNLSLPVTDYAYKVYFQVYISRSLSIVSHSADKITNEPRHNNMNNNYYTPIQPATIYTISL